MTDKTIKHCPTDTNDVILINCSLFYHSGFTYIIVLRNSLVWPL
jgi:hypothetical protein